MDKKSRPTNGAGFLLQQLQGTYVDRTEFAAVLGIRLGFKLDLLAFRQGLEAIHLDRGEMHKNIVAAIVIGDEAEAFFRIEPFNCTVHYVWYLQIINYILRTTKRLTAF